MRLLVVLLLPALGSTRFAPNIQPNVIFHLLDHPDGVLTAPNSAIYTYGSKAYRDGVTDNWLVQ